MVTALADYTWKQWEAEQNDSNLLHASDCERWQAGIELAGGTWDGEWVDLDTSGKGLITIDQFNALESQIQSKVSGYTPKNYDPDSTVQIVPGPDGWNKVEDGILKAVCEPDGINQNVLLNTHDMTLKTGEIVQVVRENATMETITDDDGFGVMVITQTASGGYYAPAILSRVLANDNPWLNKRISFSVDLKCDELTSNFSNVRTYFCVYGTNNGTSWTRKASMGTGGSDYSISNNTWWDKTNTDELVDGEWCRLKRSMTLTQDPFTDWTQNSSSEFSTYVYGIIMRCAVDNLSIRKPKIELADGCTDWSPAMEDYGYSDGTITFSASASPQSVEESDEVAAPEAEEIE